MDEIIYVDYPNKKQIHSNYEHRTAKLNKKHNDFSSRKFQHVRNVSTRKKILKSLGQIGMRVNNMPISIIPKIDLNKICFIIINDYKLKDKNLGVGPLNDGYLIGLKLYRLGFKIFYLYNPKIKEFPLYLQFFMNNTDKLLTVFYTGRDDSSEGIIFNNGTLSKSYIEKLISSNSNNKVRFLFITDCVGSGSVFDIRNCSNSMSFSVNKKQSKDSHGIFTYYLCKIISECPSTTPNMLVQKMNSSLSRFNEFFKCELTLKELGEIPIFYG